MTFSGSIKEELSNINSWKNKNLLEAEFLGYILTGNSLQNDEYIEFITENEFNIERFYKILFNLEIEYEPEIDGKNYVARINKNEIENRFQSIGLNPSDEIKRIIIRGSFLGAGSITDPEKSYHLEINFGDKKNAEYVSNLCKPFGVNFKLLENKEKYVIYLKDSEQISTFLACIGANKAVLKFEDVKVFKDMKNNVNRQVNCEAANLNKTIDAALEQIEDIKLIQKMKKFEDLSPELREVASIRIEHPENSLKEIGGMLEKPLGKSGVNHRLKKIHDFAEELRR